MEIVFLCVVNLCDYSLVSSLDSASICLASLLASCGQACMDTLYGVTPSATFLSDAATAGNWTLSPCLDSKYTTLCARQTTVAAAQAMASLYAAAEAAAATRPIALLPSPGLASINVAGVASVAPTLLPCVLRYLGVPLVEVNQAVCDLIACIANAGGGLALSQNENMVSS